MLELYKFLKFRKVNLLKINHKQKQNFKLRKKHLIRSKTALNSLFWTNRSENLLDLNANSDSTQKIRSYRPFKYSVWINKTKSTQKDQNYMIKR